VRLLAEREQTNQYKSVMIIAQNDLDDGLDGLIMELVEIVDEKRRKKPSNFF